MLQHNACVEKRVMMPSPPQCSQPRKIGNIESIEPELRCACNALIDSVNLLRDRLSSVLSQIPAGACAQGMLKEVPMCVVASALASDLALVRQADAMIHHIVGDLEL